MSKVQQSIEVDVPVRTAYDQWTQFESFPEFMDGVQEVRQLDDRTLEWHAKVGGKEKTWKAEVVDQTPDQRISWRSIDGAPNGGVVSFESLGQDRTRVQLELEAEPEGAVEQVGDALGLLDRRVKGDLEKFKSFIESRQVPTGAWRGEVHGGDVKQS